MNSVIATTPAGMLEAQGKMQQWIGSKLADAQQDLRDADEVFRALQSTGMRTNHAARQQSVARARITFYEKVKAALDAGYYIIPPFDVQVFAIRTDRAPLSHESDSHWRKEQQARRLPVGEGGYENPDVPRLEHRTIQKPKTDGTGTYPVAIYRNDHVWPENIELPERAQKPTIIEATAKALGELIFDALAIAPQYRAADPIIVGQIRHWKANRAPLTFFVAWWMDERDL